MQKLTNEEKDLLQDMLNVYADHVKQRVEASNDFIGMAHLTGDIASSGEKYTENTKFWEVRDNIRRHFETSRNKANILIGKIINS